MTYIYSIDGSKKVDIDTATMIGDVGSDLKIYQQGNDSQLWKSANGSYFKGMCLHHAQGVGGIVKYARFIPMSYNAAKQWVLYYYGPAKLSEFGFVDDAEEI